MDTLNNYLFPSYLRPSHKTKEAEEKILLSNITTSFNSQLSLYKAHQIDLLDSIFTYFSGNIPHDFLPFISRLGNYAIRPRTLMKFLALLNTKNCSQDLLETLSQMSSGEAAGGLSFDLSSGVANIKNYAWVPAPPFTIFLWAYLPKGNYTILDVVSPSGHNGIALTLQDNILTIANGASCTFQTRVPTST
ncbi:hypothetical protein EIN_087620, partial [Entamoeba invadens IP1]|uniref:hypothetical protein n=1 Tax=Entamoeba invadens IP1 TaxID=370355 RepID=UPI0002C3D2C0